MSRLLLEQGGRASFTCPGCNTFHTVRVEGEGAWQWNGSEDAPTLNPSVLAQSGHYSPNRSANKCWCTWSAEHPEEPAPFHCYRCHSFIRDGKIMFLADCTHALAGQTIDLPEYHEC